MLKTWEVAKEFPMLNDGWDGEYELEILPHDVADEEENDCWHTLGFRDTLAEVNEFAARYVALCPYYRAWRITHYPGRHP